MISIAGKTLLFLLAAGLALAQNAGGGLQNPFGDDPKAAAAGREMFRVHCASCHGAQGEGGSGPNLTEGVYGIGNRDQDLHQIVMRGRDVMPGFRHLMTQENVWQMVTYLRSLAGRNLGVAPGDATAGAQLFWGRGGCGQCHRVGPNGSGTGPDLTQIGIRRGAPNLRESLLSPDAGVPAGYSMVTLVTRDGQNLQGIRRRSDNFSVQFSDMQGNFYSYLRDEVKEITESAKSLMPAYGNTFSETELNDLVAFLSRLGREKSQ